MSYRYSCFDHYGEDAQNYGYAASYNLSDSCRDEVIKQLVDLQRRAADYMNCDGFVARDEFFYAEQNARLVKNAEEYCREMFRGRVSSWNLRDRHMTETIIALAEHLKTQNKTAKIVVGRIILISATHERRIWAHAANGTSDSLPEKSSAAKMS